MKTTVRMTLLDGDSAEFDLEGVLNAINVKTNELTTVVNTLNRNVETHQDGLERAYEHFDYIFAHRNREVHIHNQNTRRFNAEIQRLDPRYRTRRTKPPGLRKRERTNWQHTGYSGR